MTELLEPMVKRALASGVDASCILMDSWFAFPSVIESLHRHRPVICMLKDLPILTYCHKNVFLRLKNLYRRVKKKPGRAAIIASVTITLKSGLPAKIVFVRNRHKRGWLALMSTDTEMSAEEIVQTYGKRWHIEVFSRYLSISIMITAWQVHSKLSIIPLSTNYCEGQRSTHRHPSYIFCGETGK